jgi:2-keto-4-pentenoate hydratase/2-oxohepta-3-ene-1,7-dioic acid hydratase in catechol pathway
MKIICIGHNYRKHIEELDSQYPENPVFFLKPESSLLRNDKDFFLPHFSNNIQHEIEIVLRINRLGKHIQAKFAHRYFDAIGIGIDFTARDLQQECKEKGLPWEISKAFDGSAAISEFIPVSKFENINNIKFELYKNNELMQVGNTSDMLFDFSKIIEYISKFMTLKIGDIIYTGTPAGISKINIGDTIIATLNDTEMINMKIK